MNVCDSLLRTVQAFACVCLWGACQSSVAAPIAYLQDFEAGTVGSGDAEQGSSGTPLNIDGTGTLYPDVYEAGDFFGGALVDNGGSAPGTGDGWGGGWTETGSGGNVMLFFDTGSPFNPAEGPSVRVKFVSGRHSGRPVDDGNIVVQLFDGLSDVTDPGNNLFTANDTPLASATIDFSDASFYDTFYNGTDASEGLIKNVSLKFTGLPATTNNLFLALTLNHDTGNNSIALVDDVQVSQIPEPSSVALLGLISLATVGRRRMR